MAGPEENTEAQEQKGMGTPEAEAQSSDSQGQNNEPATLEEFEARCIADEQYRNEYMNNPHDERFEKFNVMMGEKISGTQALPQGQETPQENPEKPEEKSAEQKSSSEQPPSQEPEDEELAVNVKIPKTMLGTYLKNRKPEEALLEALKGNQEKDRYIERLRTERDRYSGELLSFKQKETTPPQAEPQAAQLPEEDPDLLSDEELSTLDLYDPENQEKLVKHQAAATRRIKALENLTKSAVETTSQITAESRRQTELDRQQERVTREYQEIEDLQSSFPELKTPKPFSQLDREVSDFYSRIAEFSQLPQDQALNVYFSESPEGQALRGKLSSLGVQQPEGYDVHQRIMAVRQDRLRDQQEYVQQLSQTVGRELNLNEVPLPPGMSYVDYWRKKQGFAAAGPRPSPAPQPSAPPTQSTQPGTGQQNQQQYAPEIPQEQSVPLMGPENMSVEQMNALAQKPVEHMSTDEAKLLVKVYEAEKIPAPTALIKKAGLI